ncbi:hypothetical protein Tco_0063916 [Tanacetum coccineum]
MKEKGDPCILVGYSTQPKEYHVYNKRTRLIVESIHLRFDEIKEMSETSVANDTSGLVSQPKKASDYDNSGPSSSPTDNSKQQDTPPTTHIHPTTEPTTPIATVHAEENNDNQAEDAHFKPYEFFNPYGTPVQELAESSSRNIDNSNMHTFYQPHQSEHRWTKDHPLTQVRGNPSKPVQPRRQLATDLEIWKLDCQAVNFGGIRFGRKQREKKGEQCLGAFWRVVRTKQLKEMYSFLEFTIFALEVGLVFAPLVLKGLTG